MEKLRGRPKELNGAWRINVYLDRDTLNALYHIAKTQRCSRSRVIRDLVRERILQGAKDESEQKLVA